MKFNLKELQSAYTSMFNESNHVNSDIIPSDIIYNKSTGLYDCDGDITIYKDSPLVKDGKLIIKFGTVSGSFNCMGSSIASFENMPQQIGGNLKFFMCPNLTSLIGCPKNVGMGYYFSRCDGLTSLEGVPEEVNTFECNRCSGLTSLEGAPINIKENFSCHGCESLTSLNGAPQSVGLTFDCSGCDKLTSLKGITQNIGGSLNCSECKSLASLEGAPERIGGSFYCYECPSLTSLEHCPKEIENYINVRNCGKNFTPKEIKSFCHAKLGIEKSHTKSWG